MRDRRVLLLSTFLPVLLMFAGLALLTGSALTQSAPKLTHSTTDHPDQASTALPFYCITSQDKWCDDVMASTAFTGAVSDRLSTKDVEPVDSLTPTVFAVKYDIPPVNATNATGYELSLGVELYNRGFGKQGRSVVKNQLGAYLLDSSSEAHVLVYNLFVNSSATHGAPVFKALIDQAIYRLISNSTRLELKVNSHPLPLTVESVAQFSSALSFLACMFVVITFTFFPASIVVFIIREKQAEHNAKHQQLISDVSLHAFWLADYAWDVLTYAISCAAALALIQTFNVQELTGNGCDGRRTRWWCCCLCSSASRSAGSRTACRTCSRSMHRLRRIRSWPTSVRACCS